MNRVLRLFYLSTTLITLVYSPFALLNAERSVTVASSQGERTGDRIDRKVWKNWSETKRKEENAVRPKTGLDTSYGLHSCYFERPEGKIILNLPDDITAGDSISGTILVKPAGQTPEQQSANQDRLNAYELEIEGQKVPPYERWARWDVPVRSKTLSIILRNQKGQEVGRTRLDVLPYSSAMASERPTLPGVRSFANHFQLPAIGQAGRPIEILGSFDGDLHNTVIRLQGQPVRVLGESPRKAVAFNPRNNIGRTEIAIVEGGLSLVCHVRNIGLSLSAPKLALDHGEETMLTVLVEGLKGLEEAVPLELENKSPIVVGLNGGNKQTISLRPEEVIDGAIRATRKLTGVGPGDFNIVVGVGRSDLPGECQTIQ